MTTKFLLIEERRYTLRLLSERLMYAAALAEMEADAEELDLQLFPRRIVQDQPWHEKHGTTDHWLTYHIYEVSVDHVVCDEDLHEIVTHGQITWQGEAADE